MPKATYRFEKAVLPGRYMSQNRISTDALNALGRWADCANGRDFKVLTEEDDLLRAQLVWNDADERAGAQLDHQCAEHGVARIFEEAE